MGAATCLCERVMNCMRMAESQVASAIPDEGDHFEGRCQGAWRHTLAFSCIVKRAAG